MQSLVSFMTGYSKDQELKQGTTWNGDVNYSELANDSENNKTRLFLTKLLELDQKMVQNDLDTCTNMESMFNNLFTYYDELDEHEKLVVKKYMFRYLFYLRNIRGQGKRSRILFYQMWSLLSKYFYEDSFNMLKLVPQYGYYEDYNNLMVHEDVREECINLLSDALRKDINTVIEKYSVPYTNSQLFTFFVDYNKKLKTMDKINEEINISLVAKWIKREGKDTYKSREGIIINLFYDKTKMEYLKINKNDLYVKKINFGQKLLRVILSSLCQLVNLTEHYMTNVTSRGWSSINFSCVPSKALTKYRKAFLSNEQTSENLMNTIRQGKINGAQQDLEKLCNIIYLHVSRRQMVTDNEKELIDSQWKKIVENVKQLVEENTEDSEIDPKNIIPVIDVSGSMSAYDVMHKGIGLGVLCSLLSNHPGLFITFSNSPTIINFDVNDNIFDIFEKVLRSEWGGSTNIDATYNLLLDMMKKSDTPSNSLFSLLILTDGQFNSMVRFNGDRDTFYERMTEKFKDNGYLAPRTIFWNLNSVSSGFPSSGSTKGVQLVSGFSQTLMQQVLTGNFVMNEDSVVDIDPYEAFINVLNSDLFLPVDELLV